LEAAELFAKKNMQTWIPEVHHLAEEVIAEQIAVCNPDLVQEIAVKIM